jgi:hypothetical protein
MCPKDFLRLGDVPYGLLKSVCVMCHRTFCDMCVMCHRAFCECL